MRGSIILKVGSMLNNQLSLPLRLRDEASFSNFFVGQQAILTQQLQATAAGEGEAFIYLWGARGLGRTHLLQATCHAAEAKGRTTMYLPLGEQLPPEVLQGMEELHLVCIDDVDAIAGDPIWEEALFHFYNRARLIGTHLVIAGLAAPMNLKIKLADLRSRLANGLSFHLAELSDAEKIIALQLRAELRGINLSQELGHFLLCHGDRQMAALIDYLDRLDEASFTAQRRLTIPFVKNILQF